MSSLSFTPPTGPRSVIRPADAGFTLLGAFGDQPTAAVDRGGAIQLLDGNWTLDWWIAAEDRIHTPASEASVRQTRLGAGPVVQTTLRVPGGDIVQRSWAAKQSIGTAIVAEFENTSATPVGLTLAVRPFDIDGAATTPEATLGSDRILADGATIWLSGQARDEIAELNGVIVPLPHKAITRVLIAGTDVAWSPGRQLPTAEDAVRGWDALITADCRVVLPDDRMTDLFDQTRGRLSLGTHDLLDRIGTLDSGAGEELLALCVAGFGKEAVDILRALLADRWHPPRLKRKDDRQPAAAVLDGLGAALSMYAPDWAIEFLPAAMELGLSVSKKGSPSQIGVAHRGLARISVAAGDRKAAGSIEPNLGIGPAGPKPDLVALTEIVQQSSETGSWARDEIAPAATALVSLRALLVREQWDNTQPEVDLFPEFPAAWRGGSVELHSIHTQFGTVSAAIRWHGYRPALLWEFERADHIMTPVRIRCSALDPNWSTTDRKGEALLTGNAEELPDAPVEGDSFS